MDGLTENLRRQLFQQLDEHSVGTILQETVKSTEIGSSHIVYSVTCKRLDDILFAGNEMIRDLRNDITPGSWIIVNKNIEVKEIEGEYQVSINITRLPTKLSSEPNQELTK